MNCGAVRSRAIELLNDRQYAEPRCINNATAVHFCRRAFAARRPRAAERCSAPGTRAPYFCASACALALVWSSSSRALASSSWILAAILLFTYMLSIRPTETMTKNMKKPTGTATAGAQGDTQTRSSFKPNQAASCVAKVLSHTQGRTKSPAR